MHPLLTNLNEEQREVVTTTEGPLLVLAGAGSGKTRSVIHRAAYLILEKNVAPWNILIVTFTNKAAQELQERLQHLIHMNTKNLWVGTFHSVCTRILRREPYALPFNNSNFSIYDGDDQKSLLRKIYKQLGIDPKKFNLNKVLNIISKQKNNLVMPEDMEDNLSNPFIKTFKRIYTEYQKQLVSNNAVDFDDILIYTYYLLKNYPETRTKYNRQFPYVMVDEYQDTNFVQFMLVRMLTGENANICVVGDDDQAIYSWRGATIRNILSFEKDFKQARIIKLEQNYRSTVPILKVANSLISRNGSRHSKELRSDNLYGERPVYKILEDERIEASFIANDIITKAEETYKSWQSFAVLYRTNAQSRLFESIFMEKNIPYLLVGTVNFFQRMEIKDTLAYLRVLVNPDDTESLLRIINTPTRGIGSTTISKLLDYAVSKQITLYDAVLGVKNNPLLNAGTINKINAFGDMLQFWQAQRLKMPLNTFVRALVTQIGFIETYTNSQDPQDLSRAENLNEFLNSVDEYFERYKNEIGDNPLLENYIQNVSLQTNVDRMGDKDNSVRLMTLHNAKGLEFDVVYIVGIEENLIPHIMSQNSNDEIEEERRLLYVGITRARKELILTRAELRRSYGSLDATVESRFISEIPDDLLIKESSFSYPIISRRKRSVVPKIVLESEKLFKVGQKVRHDEYGEGLILNVDGKDINAILTISFAKGQLKKIKGSYIEIIL
ncbi:MAG: UvrD-helicase domain-containing protein [Candidatus Cloacimonetes bacterium]|nr:UvrD-helicase domain-containing protein [Candidatus Cloacimonadota bacterium]